MATIKVMQNGPYLVQGDDVTAVDWNGATYAIAKRPFALCRCGGSTSKPFCDGTHSRRGVQAAEAAVPGSGDKPAVESQAGRGGEAGREERASPPPRPSRPTWDPVFFPCEPLV